jgi:hypothetical protein
MVRDEDAWFEISRTATSITAIPVKPIGWLVFLGLLIGCIALTSVASFVAMTVHVALFVLALLAGLALTFFLLFAVIRAKGRERR